MPTCTACGTVANYLTCLKRYGKPPKKPCFDVSTFHEGECTYCGRKTLVTEERDFFYPDFGLIGEVREYFRDKYKD